ncbi:MAG: phospholipase [Thermoleophilaceae bacterium]|jgi:phospholipase C|nr:phospholipase [Thermoleophilaceae bacterium]
MTDEERLNQIEHIVVLMMENRSFDHMLGYLTQARMPDVRGLDGTNVNLDAEGGKHRSHVFHARGNKVRRGEALEKNLDPNHSPKSVKEQLRGTNGGFVKDYVATRAPSDDGEFPRDLWNVPMGYYEGRDLVTYDHLARNYCVCDAWHASIPGDTWPNRVFAVAGRKAEPVWKQSDLFKRLTSFPGLKKLRNIPLYDVPAFTHQLDDGDWRWYSHDPATLRAVDGAYRDLHDLKQDNFAWFDRKLINRRTLWLEERALDIVENDSFLDDAVNGQLRKVSWIDPNFVDLHVLDPNSNDDHPPSDILAGQQFVFDVYEALRKSPGWDDTVLVITYDEHGGFYDHVSPPRVNDGSGYGTLGVRVPALIVGPRVRKGVYHEAPGDEAWDHTALIRSILLAFAADPDAAIKNMGGRVARRKAHLGMMLEDKPRKDLPKEAGRAETRLRKWRQTARAAREASARAKPSKALDGAGRPLVLTDFQDEWAAFASAMRKVGAPGP